MTMTQMVLSVPRGMPIPAAMSASVRGAAKLSAAKALPSRPASVIATWMVERNFAGREVSLISRPARLSPASANFSSLFSLVEMTAISALAKTAFRKISITCKIIAVIIISFKTTKRHSHRRMATPFILSQRFRRLSSMGEAIEPSPSTRNKFSLSFDLY